MTFVNNKVFLHWNWPIRPAWICCACEPSVWGAGLRVPRNVARSQPCWVHQSMTFRGAIPRQYSTSTGMVLGSRWFSCSAVRPLPNHDVARCSRIQRCGNFCDERQAVTAYRLLSTPCTRVMFGIAHNTGVIKAVCGRVVGEFPWLARVGAQLPGVADRHLRFQ